MMPEPSELPPPAAPGSPLRLTPEASPSGGDAEVTRAQLDAWSALYGPEHRQLRRWIHRGRERSDPCPLDEPAKMPAWVDRSLSRINRQMRDRVQAAADLALARANAPSPVDSAALEKNAAPVPGAPPVVLVKPLDLATVGGVEGEAVDLNRKLFAATRKLLEEAYAEGNEERIGKYHARIEKVGEALRKHEAAAEAKARRRGDLLDRGEVLSDVAHAISMLKVMHQQQAKLILAELPGLDPETTERLRLLIERTRERELAALRNLSALRTAADVQLALAA